MSWPGALMAAFSLLLGAGVGAAYFLLLSRGVRLQAAGAGGGGVVALLAAARIALAVGAFWAVAQAGAAALLLAFGGFLLARFALQTRLMKG